MSETISAEFKFSIGDFVSMKGATVVEAEYGGKKLLPQKGLITGLLLEKCPGGFQNHYTIRWLMRSPTAMMSGDSFSTSNTLFKHLEEELVPAME